jgi:hypothetical protein
MEKQEIEYDFAVTDSTGEVIAMMSDIASAAISDPSIIRDEIDREIIQDLKKLKEL